MTRSSSEVRVSVHTSHILEECSAHVKMRRGCVAKGDWGLSQGKYRPGFISCVPLANLTTVVLLTCAREWYSTRSEFQLGFWKTKCREMCLFPDRCCWRWMHRCCRGKEAPMSVKTNLCSKREHSKVVCRITVFFSFYVFLIVVLFILWKMIFVDCRHFGVLPHAAC